MRSATLFGFIVGLAFPLATKVAPQPAGSILWWGLAAVQLAWASALVRERTGLLFSSLAMALGSVFAIAMVAAAATGYDLFTLPMPWLALLWSGVFVVPILLYVDKLVEPTKWEAWKAHQESMSLWDLLRFRHIPSL